LIDVSTAEPAKKREKRKKSTVESPAPTSLADEESAESAESVPESTEIAPWPDFGVWKAGGTKSEQKVSPTAGFNYWNHTLTAAQRIFGTWYAYRLWPVMKLQQKGNKFVNPNCAKFSAEDGPISSDLIHGQLRIGVYLLRLLQRQTSPSGQVAMCEIEVKGSGNFDEDEMPILDVEQVDWEHPSNAEYAKICRSRGILKAEEPENQSEGAEEMAATSVLGEIASKAFDKMGQQQPAQQPQSDIGGGVGTELVGLLREQITMNRPPSQQGTVKDQLEGLVTLAKTMTPPAAAPPDMGPYIALQRQNNELVERVMNMQVQQAQAEAAKARAEADEIRQALPKPKTVDEQWDELERAAKRFDRMTGKKKVEDEPDDEKENPATAAGFFGSLLGYVPAIRDLLHEVNIGLYNFRLNGSGVPPLNPATGQPGTEPLAPEMADTDDDPPLSPADQAKMEHMQNVVNQLSALAQPMLSHLMRNKPGGEFAKFVIENYGPQAFELVRGVEGGRDTILAMIQQYPPVWNQIGPARLPQFTKFLDEFMMYSGVPVQ
jgi:hypothetical protein